MNINDILSYELSIQSFSNMGWVGYTILGVLAYVIGFFTIGKVVARKHLKSAAEYNLQQYDSARDWKNGLHDVDYELATVLTVAYPIVAPMKVLAFVVTKILSGTVSILIGTVKGFAPKP